MPAALSFTSIHQFIISRGRNCLHAFGGRLSTPRLLARGSVHGVLPRSTARDPIRGVVVIDAGRVGDGRRRLRRRLRRLPRDPALAKPPSSTLPLAFPTASPALPQLLNAMNVPLGGDTIDALAARPLSLSRRFSIDSVVAIIGSGKGAIVVL